MISWVGDDPGQQRLAKAPEGTASETQCLGQLKGWSMGEVLAVKPCSSEPRTSSEGGWASPRPPFLPPLPHTPSE